ncbi:Sporulation-control protein spo0M [Grimontia celer]|uniref:Sporulation-control protein spo0M n=1 Tax=Grimontia celer TaxID=1796497 RepID=A0A128FEC7_9GAMM|nr:sporulation protein [Grimontia celer]CZF85162.1 Sporulation-control protein spo0M [Grimontia celer]
MGWLKKTLAKVGFGSAEVSVELDSTTLIQGEQTKVLVTVTGGDVGQPVDAIELSVCCDYMGWEELRAQGEQGRKKQRRRKSYVLAKWALPDAFTTEPGKSTHFESAMTLPLNTPLSMGDGKIWLEVNLDIPMGKDTSSKTELTVKPDNQLDAAFTAFEKSGFRIEKVKNEEVERQSMPFEQRFEWAPVSEPSQSVFREMTLVATRPEDGLHLAMIFGRQGEGIGAAVGRFVGANKLSRELTLSGGPEEVASEVKTLLAQISQ